MVFGINKLGRFLSPKYIYSILKRKKQLSSHKGKGLILGLNSNISQSQIGKNVFIGGQSSLLFSSIGDYSYINSNTQIRNTSIGKFCSIASGVKIVLGNHPTHLISLHPTFYANNKPYATFADDTYFQEYFDVEIGNDVWIGEDVMIPGGVSIGDGAVIASRSVVTKDVDAYSIVGGVPAKHIRYRFSEEERDLLSKYTWWNKEENWLQENWKLFQNKEAFMKLIRKELCVE